MRRIIVSIAIISIILITQLVFADDAVYRTIPVYNPRDPGQTTPKLELRIKEKVYPHDAVYTLSEMLEKAKNPYNSPEDNLLGYIGYMISGKTGEVTRFYHPDDKNSYWGLKPLQVAKTFAKHYKGRKRVKLLRAWHYGRYWDIMVEFLPHMGKKNIILYGIKKIGDKYYMTLGQGGPIGRIVSYVMGNYRRGVGDRFTPVELPYSLTYYATDVDGSIMRENPVTLYFTGKAYGFEDGWVSAEDIDPVVKFVHDSMTIAATGTDEEYLALFTGIDRDYMEEILELARKKGKYRNMTFVSYKHQHSKFYNKELKHVFTLDLGTEYVHYYRVKGEPELRYQIFRNRDGRQWLTVIHENDFREDTMSRNIKELIKDDKFIDKIIEIWKEKKKEDNNK